jgi:hypothetical protein
MAMMSARIESGQATPAGAAGVGGLVPRPRAPLADTLRRVICRPTPASTVDLDQVLAHLTEVAAVTSRDGSWQEHASFLLSTEDGQRHLVGFSEPSAGALITRLRELPGFDTDLLLDLIGSRTQRLTVLWRAAGPRP